MIVRELIDELKKFPESYRIMMEADAGIADISEVSLDRDWDFNPPEEFALIIAKG